MVHYLGPPPRSFVTRSRLGEYFFDKEGKIFTLKSYSYAHTYAWVGRVKGLPSPTFQRIWEWEENLAGEEQKEFFDFLKSMLRWLPEERLSARQLLEHPWLKDEET